MRILSLILTVALLAVSVTGCGDENGAEKAEAKSMEQIMATKGVPVKTELVEAHPFGSEYSYYSVLSGYAESTASAMVSDEVESIKYKVGDRVKKDAVVITFPTDNPAAQYYQAKVAYEHAETTVKRIKNLYENGGISLQEYDNARTQYDVSKANWDTVKQTITVKAPISGIITKMSVRKADNVEPGDPLFTVSTTHKLKATVFVSESQITDVTTGNPVTATWQGITLNGKVVQVDLSLNQDKQAFGVISEFDNPGNRMMNGVNAEIVLKGEESSESIVIERKNILNDGENDYVYLAENGAAVKRPVKLGRSKGLDLEILEGLNLGEQLIVEGMLLLNNNAKISVKQ